jgi:hypothetical protein
MPVSTTDLKCTSGMLFCYSWDSRHRSDTAPRPGGTGTGTGTGHCKEMPIVYFPWAGWSAGPGTDLAWLSHYLLPCLEPGCSMSSSRPKSLFWTDSVVRSAARKPALGKRGDLVRNGVPGEGLGSTGGPDWDWDWDWGIGEFGDFFPAYGLGLPHYLAMGKKAPKPRKNKKGKRRERRDTVLGVGNCEIRITVRQIRVGGNVAFLFSPRLLRTNWSSVKCYSTVRGGTGNTRALEFPI